MNIYRFIFSFVLLFISTRLFGHCLLRHHCQVLEKKYFEQYLDLRFKECGRLVNFDFSVAVSCNTTEPLGAALKEVPSETDWLCLTIFKGNQMEVEAFSQFTKLKALCIIFSSLNAHVIESTELLPGTFTGLSQLSTLWIESRYRTFDITFYEDTFQELHSLKELKITDVPLSTFNISIFGHLHHLEHLILKRNDIFNLADVTSSLGTLTNLQRLSIRDNNIGFRQTDCQTSTFPEHYGQPIHFNISYLDFSHNVIHAIGNNSLCNFPKLEMFKAERIGLRVKDLLDSGIKSVKTMSISNNALIEFKICTYASHYKVEELVIRYNNIYTMETLEGSCKHLKKLDLTYNELEEIRVSQMKRLSHLLELHLSNNAIEKLKICKNASVPEMKLVYLNLSFNHLLGLQESQFSCLVDLKVLSLENNRINYIQDYSFEGLDKLEFLNLKHNSLYIIREEMFSNLFFLQHLDLYENAIETIEGTTFRNLAYLQNLSLTYNMFDLGWWNFLGRFPKHLDLNSRILEIRKEMIYGFPVLESLEMDSAEIIITCSEFEQVKELRLKNIEHFNCDDLGEIPLANMTNLEKLYYTGHPQDTSDLTLEIGLKYVPWLNFLCLQDTDHLIRYGKLNVSGLFRGLAHLKVLHLKNSGIDHLDSKDIFSDLRDLEFLLIENQNMQEVVETIFESMPKLKYVYFLHTTFPCNCKFNSLLSWLESGKSVSVINLHDQECRIQHITFNLVSFLHENCQFDLGFVVFVATFVFTSLLICTSLIYESLWWYTLYIIYTVKCWLNRKEKERDRYQYDVFVSYNTHNELWVTEQFLPNLEANGPLFFKVCIHNRDFEIGRDIVDNIMDSIYNSRWTVCVITRSYLQSNWCSLEMRMATYRLLAESKDSLILVFLDKIPREELQHYHRLTKLMDKKTYLDWPNDEKGQQLFWAKLRKVVSRSGRKA